MHRYGLGLLSALLGVSCGVPESGEYGHSDRGMTGYYATVDASSSSLLRSTLHAAIDDHQRYPYSSTALDTWDILELADEDPADMGRILDLYRNASYLKVGGGTGGYNREHTWPSSYGFPNDNASNYPYTDTHALFLVASGENSARSNKLYRDCSPTCEERVTQFNNGEGGGSGVYPGNSNWTSGFGTTGSWETWIGRRGDVARAILYLDVRYEGGTHGGTGISEPDLIVTDSETLISNSNTGSNQSVAYMGLRNVLLRWHVEDPPDAVELARNDVIFGFQGNRNPFVDHPEWVACAFDATCGDVTAPAAPATVVATPASARVDLDWADNLEADLLGYFVYRSTTPTGPYTRLNPSIATTSQYSDGSAQNNTTYYYVVTAVDRAGNASALSAEVSATPQSGTGSVAVWINEFHYDNASSDVGEHVEIAGPAGTDLTGWSVAGYNGSNGTTYKTVNLSGTIPDQGGCLGTLAFTFSSMQNGAPDGLALVDSAGSVREFISYEGTLVATNGPASGMTATDVGVSEASSTPAGHSLQRAGTGAVGGDFTWQTPGPETRGLINSGQTFDACTGGCTVDADCDDALFCNGNETCSAGACVAGTPPVIDDGVACTVDSCDEAADAVVNAPVDGLCSDSAFCNGTETCDAALGCQAGTAPATDDGVACTIDSCDEATDNILHIADDGLCSDGAFCNGAETCDVALDCQAGAAPATDDGIACTLDSCDEVTDSIVHVTNDGLCSDGAFCNGAETCSATLGCQAGADPCGGQSCDEVADACVSCLVNADCDDGAFCNGAETCSAGACVAGTAPATDDGVGCTVDSCDELTDSIVHAPNDGLCDDGAFCNGAETCSATLDCQAAAPVDCSGLDDACNLGVCDEPSQACLPNPQPVGTTCDDGDACTASDQCDGAGQCGGTPSCAGGPSIESVSLTTGSGWTTVSLPRSYVSPVIVCTPTYSVSSPPVVVRMQNAAGASFEVSTFRVDASQGPIGGVEVQCVVAEEGTYTAAVDGITMEAVRYVSTVTDNRASWAGETRTYANAYSSPVVLGQVMSANDGDWSTFWCRGTGNRNAPPSSSGLRTGKHVAEDPWTTRASETVGYFVIEAGSGTVGGRAYSAGLGADSVRGTGNNPPYAYPVSGLSAASAAVVTQAAMDGNNGGWAHFYGPGAVSANQLMLAIDEDQLRDSERAHTTEQVGFFVLE